MGTPTITDPVDTDEIRTLAAAQKDHIDERELPFVYGLVAGDIPAMCAEIDRLRAVLRGPCGFCHPCTNWSAEKLRAAIEQNREDVMDAEEPARAYEACERPWAVLDPT